MGQKALQMVLITFSSKRTGVRQNLSTSENSENEFERCVLLISITD